jgi:putative ABC transport system substrate-binding protein
MRNLLAVVFPALALALAGCAAMPPSTPAGGTDAVERNKALVRELTEVVWNQRGLDRIPDFYGPDFVADYRPYGLRQGHEGIRASVADAWTAFPDYHEELLELIGEGDRVVVHLTISGTQRGLSDEQMITVGDSPRRIADFALRKRLPSIGNIDYATAGGMLGYGVVWTDVMRGSMILVDKILKGAKPADLPIQRATKFELVANLKTAKALGVTMPPSLLLRADKVIQ